MPNDVYKAIDAVLVLGVDDTSTPEGEIANTLVTEYDLSNVVGRLTNVNISVSSELSPFYELGRRYPTHLRPGVIRVFGTAERGHVNGALLRLLLGKGAVSPPGAPNFVQPSFNLIASLVGPVRPDQLSRITVFSVKFASWTYNIPLEHFVMESVSFQALRIAFEEA